MLGPWAIWKTQGTAALGSADSCHTDYRPRQPARAADFTKENLPMVNGCSKIFKKYSINQNPLSGHFE